MNRSQRIAIWVLTLVGLLAAWKLFGQGFGNFRTDQPFLARNYTTATTNPIVMIAYFDTRSDTNVLKSGTVVTNWLNLTNASDPATTSIASAATWVASGGAGNFGYLSFGGSASYLFYPTNTTNGSYTVAMLFLTLTGDGFGIFGDNGTLSRTRGCWFETVYTPFGMDVGEWTPRDSDCYVNVSAVPVIGNWTRLVCTIGLNKVQMWTNGVYAGIDTTDCGNDYATSPYLIGKAYNSSYNINGWIHRFMMWNGELSSNDCVSVDAQIKSEFGL